MHVGRYSKSILHLIANAFEEWAVPDIGKTRDSGLRMGQAKPPLILGMGRARTKDDEEGSKKVAPMKTELTFDRSRDLPARKAAGGLSVVEIEAPKSRPGPFEFQDLIYHPDIQADILKRIRSDAADR
jgi:hypothetical protein